jgi:phosphoribosylanthranilate isomerase
MSNMPPLIKICGLTQASDAAAAAGLGADLCGFVFHPKSPRYVTAKAAKQLATPGAKRVGVFVEQGVEEIISIMQEAELDMAQLHGNQGPEVAKALGWQRVIRVFWPERYPKTAGNPADGESNGFTRDLELWHDLAAYFLFDAGVKEGGHGKRLSSPSFDSPKPYFLAGGLCPNDIVSMWPFKIKNLCGFDLNSGVEKSPGIKDHAALRDLFSIFRSINY